MTAVCVCVCCVCRNGRDGGQGGRNGGEDGEAAKGLRPGEGEESGSHQQTGRCKLCVYVLKLMKKVQRFCISN